MRVLLSAYACEPGAGSERGKGWEFAMELARQGCDVTVLSCGSHHRAAIERHQTLSPLPPNLRFVWHDVPGWAGPGYDKARHIRKHYFLWQLTARRRVRALQADHPFDVIHHLTWTALRWPSFLGGLGPRFVFGPVGGGESTPRALRKDFPARGRRAELKRDFANFVSRFDPLVWQCLARADVVLVTDEATRRHVPQPLRHKTRLMADIATPPVTAPPALAVDRTRLLFAGRLEYWKGAQLALGALARLRMRQPEATLTLAGSGPEDAYLRAEADALGVSSAVTFTGQIPHAEMDRLYARHAILLFPTLHDSGPGVIGEALARGLPVVCLDLGGPALAIDQSCGAVIPTAAASRSMVESRLAEALYQIINSDELYRKLQAGAQRRAAELNTPARVRAIIDTCYAAQEEAPPASLGTLANGMGSHG